MYLLRLCATQEYSPRLLEHWLCTMQKSRTQIEIILFEKFGKVHILTSHDLSSEFPGSRSIVYNRSAETAEQANKQNGRKYSYNILQKKGTLLPIKRAAQFEDRVNKERIFPTDTLIQLMSKQPGSFLHFHCTAIPDRRRQRALKKAKRIWFKPDRLLDQWESKTWFLHPLSPSPRRILCPLIRKGLMHLSVARSHKSSSSQNLRETQEQMESIHEREDPRTAILDKLSRPLFKVQMTLSHPFSNFIHGFTLPYLGELKISKQHASQLSKIKSPSMILSAEELASIASMPNPKNSAALLNTESTAYFPPPENPIQISENDRRRHLYLIGKTGMGKSTLILNLLKQDLQSQHPIILFDPHGDLIEDALTLIPQNRHKGTIVIDPSQTEAALALNPIQLHPGESPSLKASALIEMFEALAKGSWGPRLEHILRNALITLISSPNTTLLDLPRILTNSTFCHSKIAHLKDPELRRFWQEEFLPQDIRTRREQIAPILNKVGPLLTSPLLRNIFAQPRSKFNFTGAIDESKIILVNLSKGKLGEDSSRMLGMTFISMIQSTLFRRAAAPMTARKTIALYIDEFQNFTTPTLISMLSESRKYGLALTLANQYLTQLRPEIQDAVLGNVGSLFAFRLSFQDAQIIAPTLGLTEEDLTNLAPFQTYGKLLKNSQTLPLFRWEVPKITTSTDPTTSAQIDKIKQLSRDKFSRKRELVEQKIQQRYNARN